MTVLVKQNKKWIYKGDVVPDDIPQNHGFVYKIEYTDGTYYYGRKDFFKVETKPEAKKDTTNQKYIDNGYKKIGFNKGGKRHYKYQKKIESNWRTYNGSSKLSKGKLIAHKEILRLCPKPIDTTYWEAYYLFNSHVLFDDMCLNNNILGKFYAEQVSGTKKFIKG